MATWAGTEAASASFDGATVGSRTRRGHAGEAAPFLCDVKRFLAGALRRTGEVGRCAAVRVDGSGVAMRLVTFVADV